MDRAPWFLDPEVLIFAQATGVFVFLVVMLVTFGRRRLAPRLLARVRNGPYR